MNTEDECYCENCEEIHSPQEFLFNNGDSKMCKYDSQAYRFPHCDVCQEITFEDEVVTLSCCDKNICLDCSDDKCKDYIKDGTQTTYCSECFSRLN
jgi:hypothetical protein